jgi:hypothetical protein
MNKPQLAALLALAAGAVLAIAGVYVLAGPGWALLAGSAPCFGLFAVIQRGLVATGGQRHGG